MLDFLDGSHVSVLVALVAGFVTFFASCLLPLVPTYLAYLSGVSLSMTGEADRQRWLLVRVAVTFVFGFITVFVTLGMLLNRFALYLQPYRVVMQQAGGMLFMVMGLFMIGVFQNQWLNQEKRFDVHNLFVKYRYVHAFLTGMAFGFGWTPCIGPVLAVILYWAAQSESMLQGLLLLTTYGIGLGIPFVVVSVGFDQVMPFLKKNSHLTRWLQIIAGSIIFIVGGLMISGNFNQFSFWVLELFRINRFAV